MIDDFLIPCSEDNVAHSNSDCSPQLLWDNKYTEPHCEKEGSYDQVDSVVYLAVYYSLHVGGFAHGPEEFWAESSLLFFLEEMNFSLL